MPYNQKNTIFPLGFSTWTAAGRAPMAYGEKLKCLASGQVPRDSFLPGKISEGRQHHYPVSEPSPTQSYRAATPYLRLHLSGSYQLSCPGDYLRLRPIQLTGVLFYIRLCYLIHRNKYREAAKMRRQTNMEEHERTEQNSRKRTKQNGDKQSISCRVQNTGY